jgi:hypothetical protein
MHMTLVDCTKPLRGHRTIEQRASSYGIAGFNLRR